MTSSSPEIVPSADPADAQPRFSYKDATHEEVLEDLSSRFILNLPDEELASLERICFQVEQAHWFYEDFIREQNPTFPSLPLKKFSAMLFHACPLLHQWSHDHENAFNMFMQYKTRVPVCGAIMLNHNWDKCLLVKGWKSSSGWGFPKGKINEDEPKHVCAIREVLEETGYNLAGKLKPEDVIELSIKEQRISLFIVPGVEEDFPFQTKTRKEISRIEWFRLSDLPTWKRNKQVPGKFYLISPFIGPLKAFINEHKARPPRKASRQQKGQKQSSRANAYGSDAIVTDIDTDILQESDSQASDNLAEKEGIGSPNRLLPPPSNDDPLKSDNIDPHFARLLTSLTLSASSNSLNPFHDTQSLTADPTTPIPNMTSRVLEPELPADPRDRSHRLNRSASSEIRRDSSSTPTANSHPISPHRTTQLREALYSPSHASNPDSPIPPSTSPLMRRPMRTDITPYLPKTTGDTTSARRLQQLALLEKVADESARMLPQTRVAPTAGKPSLPATHLGSLISSPPPVSAGAVPPQGIYYSSSPQQLLINPVHSYSGAGSNTNQTDFQARAKTSQAYHRSPVQPSGSLSMNQSQLLALMNNAQPPHSFSQSMPTPQQSTPYSNIYNSPTHYSSVTNIPPYPMARNVGPIVPPHSAFSSIPNRFASATPAVDSLATRTVPGNTAQTLLSILNGNRPLQSNPIVTSTSANRPT